MDSFFTLDQGIAGDSLSHILDGFGKDETVVAFSPHDDDALLGCGYLLSHLTARNVPVKIIVFCDGDAGYSSVDDLNAIARIRKKETRDAYAKIGVAPQDIHYMGIPDFSLSSYTARKTPSGHTGVMDQLIRLLRQWRATRLLIPNGYMEHQDHTAAYQIGIYDAVQASDPILSDLGAPTTLRSLLVYSVWADFSPEDALVSGRSDAIRANCGIMTQEDTERLIMDALRCFHSQKAIIGDLMEKRSNRCLDIGWIELYQRVLPRPRLAYETYAPVVQSIYRPSAEPISLFR